jgi:hypothetical protein
MTKAPDVTDREVIQVKIFDAPLDRLRALEDEINTWLKENREVRPDRIQFNTVDAKRAVVVVWYTMTRAARGVGFGEAVQAGRS